MGPNLTPEQDAAVAAIVAAHGRFAPFVLHGVTGSGKTEVYLRAIAAVVARGEQALVLVPEISLTPQLVARFAARFPGPLAVLHSGLTDTDRLQAWRAARAGSAPVVIGTRSAVFAPLARPGLIVSTKSTTRRTSSRMASATPRATWRWPARSATASPSCWARRRRRSKASSASAPGRAQRLDLPNRAAGARPPSLHLIDLRAHADTQGIATPTLLAIRRHLDAGGQVLIYLNRRGYAPTLFCPAAAGSRRARAATRD